MKIKNVLTGMIAFVILGTAGVIGYGVSTTENDIQNFERQISELSLRHPVEYTMADVQGVPEPVQRYFNFTFNKGTISISSVELSAEGDFRRPLTDTFNETSANQTIAIGTPALMFSANTPLIPGIWARAYDYYAEGQMEMKAKVLSVLTVVDEKESEELNQISLRRWLLESALYPASLLPGGPVSWEAIDNHTAKATVSSGGTSASMVAVFDSTGRMTEMYAEEDGDLNTPYHGSGEHVSRFDYKPVQGMMIPHSFVISRMAEGVKHPFWRGNITQITYK